jgi:hypothetical protein
MDSLLRPWRSVHDGNPRFESFNAHALLSGERGPAAKTSENPRTENRRAATAQNAHRKKGGGRGGTRRKPDFRKWFGF